MKNNTKIKGILNLALVIILTTFVYAVIIHPINLRYAEFDDFGNWSTTQNPVTNVTVFGVLCADSLCSQIIEGPWKINETTQTDSFNINYPNVPNATRYGVYFVKEGYIPYEFSEIWSTDFTGNVTLNSSEAFLSKMNGCESKLKNVEFYFDNSSKELVISGIVKSSIVHAGPLISVPEEIKEHYETKVSVNLEINNYNETQMFTIPYSGEENFEFNFSVEENKIYSVRVYTSLEQESKCINFYESSRSYQLNTTKENPSTNLPEILSIKTYSSNAYRTEKNEFFRGNNLFVEVNLSDNSSIEKLLMEKPNSGHKINLTKVAQIGNSSYFEIEIPSSLETSNKYNFLVYFSSENVTQKEIDLTIKNNPPVFLEMSKLKLIKGKSQTINILNSANDIEDKRSDLIWSFSQDSSSEISISLNGKNLQIKGSKTGKETINLKVCDLDGDCDEGELKIEIKKEDSSDDDDDDNDKEDEDNEEEIIPSQTNVINHVYSDDEEGNKVTPQISLAFEKKTTNVSNNCFLILVLSLAIWILVLLGLIYLFVNKKTKEL